MYHSPRSRAESALQEPAFAASSSDPARLRPHAVGAGLRGEAGIASFARGGGQAALDLERMTPVTHDPTADLDALQERLRDRDAAQNPAVLAHAAEAVRALVAALGTSQGGLARELGGVNEKTVRDWCAAKAVPGPPAVRAMRLLAERLVAPPPPEMAMGTGRVAPCAEVLGPHLDALMERAEAAGWQPEEVAAAAAAWAASRGGRSGGGRPT